MESGVSPRRRLRGAAVAWLRPCAVLLALPAAAVGPATLDEPAYALAALAVALGVVAALRRALRPPGDTEPARPPRAATGAAAAIGLGVFALAILSSRYHMAALSTPIAPDTNTYWSTLADLIRRTPGAVSIRTPLYSLLFGVVHALGGDGSHLLGVQIALRAAACALVAFLLARRSRIAGSGVGVVLAWDPVSAASSVSYLSESLFTTGLLLSLVLVVAQPARGPRLGRLEAIAAGLVFGWAFLFRPNGVALIVPVVAAYAIALRSWLRACLPLLGFSLVVAVVMLLNVWRTGSARLASTGLYLAFPLFSQQLFDPRNGPVSTDMHQRLVACHPDLDYRQINGGRSNEFIHGMFTPCLAKTAAREADVFAAYGAAYAEAFRARPALFTARMLLEAGRFLATTASYYPAQVGQFGELTDLGRLCRRDEPFQGYAPALIEFVCPMPEPSPARRAEVVRAGWATRLLYQPYLALYDPTPYRVGFFETPRPEATGAAGLLFFLLVFVVVPPVHRAWVVGSVALIGYNALVTAAGQVTILRYLAVVSPFLLIVSGLFAATLVEEAAIALRRTATLLRGGRAPDASQVSIAPTGARPREST